MRTPDKEARNNLLKARTAMVMDHPFFATLALRLNLKEDRTCHTAWTDGKTFGYNPDYIKILPREKLIGLCAHTVMHPACGHHLRRGNRDSDTWNRACDYVINPILIRAGLNLPQGFLFDPSHEKKSAEQVYADLKAGDTQGSEQDSDLENTVEAPNKNRQDRESTREQTENQAAEGQNTGDSELSGPGPAGEVRDGDTAFDPGDGSQTETDWEQALAQAAASARAMGKLPRGIEIFLKERFSPTLPWEALLSRFIHQSAREDYTWSRPNRRYIHQGLYFPSLMSNQLPEMAVAVDTSGSIRPRELKRFGNELSAILAMNPARVHLMYADMAVTRHETLSPWDLPFDFRPRGGGGTDFRPVFEYVDHHMPPPFCMIFFSDLECRLFPKRPPEYPVLWIRTGKGGVSPPFGRVIDLPSPSNRFESRAA